MSKDVKVVKTANPVEPKTENSGTAKTLRFLKENFPSAGEYKKAREVYDDFARGNWKNEMLNSGQEGKTYYRFELTTLSGDAVIPEWCFKSRNIFARQLKEDHGFDPSLISPIQWDYYKPFWVMPEKKTVYFEVSW